MEESPTECFFNCGDVRTPLINITNIRKKKIISSSKRRRDQNVKRRLEFSSGPLMCHKNCVSTYTSKTHVKRHLKRKVSFTDDAENAALCPKRLKRHGEKFEFESYCFICANKCTFDKKHPKVNRNISECLNGDEESMKSKILEACYLRDDDQSERIRLRIGSVRSLADACARYHRTCLSSFMKVRHTKHATTSSKDQKADSNFNDATAFRKVATILKENRSRTWTSSEVHRLYTEHSGSTLYKDAKHELIKKLEEHFSGDLLVFTARGTSSLLIFRDMASKTLRTCDPDSAPCSDANLVKDIVKESKRLPISNDNYQSRIDISSAKKAVSPSLMLFLEHLSPKLKDTLPAIMIGNIITSVLLSHPTNLLVALGVLLRERSLVDKMSSFGACCTYQEVLTFKTSSAKAASSIQDSEGVFDANNGLVQVVADNFDANISSQNGLKSTHALAMLLTQTSTAAEDIPSDVPNIPRLGREDTKVELSSDIPIMQYYGQKKPPMPSGSNVKAVKKLSDIAQTQVIANHANELDFRFLKSVVSNPAETPEFSGFNKKILRELGTRPGTATKAKYLPLIDMTPSDPTTMKTAMIEAKKLSNRCGQRYTVFTADQQLYRVMVHVIWSSSTEFVDFIPRLGGMHMLMSFVGCVGTLMLNSGLEDVLKAGFGGVPKMLTGKNFPQNTRALRLLVEEVLREVLMTSDTHGDMSNTLEKKAASSRTAKLWIDCLIKPVLIMMQFVRAERTGNWQLHIQTTASMMPYFFAAGHTNYARYGLHYLRQMESLPSDILRHFKNGEHVMRHRSGVWNGIWSDMFIESTFMRYGHGPGGIIGITLNQPALKRWALSLHACSQLVKDLADMTDSRKTVGPDEEKHKEEATSRIAADSVDRAAMRDKLVRCIDPLDPQQHPSGLVNIVTGHISEDPNVDDALSLGTKLMSSFESSLPTGFHGTIPKTVTTMTTPNNKRLRARGEPVACDPELIYARVMGLASTRQFDLENIFHHELSPAPTSLFDDYGDMRAAKGKSTLKRKLMVETVKQPQTPVQSKARIIDGCAALWVISWPCSGTVQDFINAFVKYIMNKLAVGDVYLVFDRYFPSSIKDSTRNNRAGDRASRKHKLTPDSPLPPQQVVLTVTENKVQVIDMICEDILNQARISKLENKLVVTDRNDVPHECFKGNIIDRPDLTTRHEEADVIIAHQVVALNKRGITSIKVISDDTDVFALLLHFHHSQQLTCNLVMVGTSADAKMIDIGETAKKHRSILPDLLAAHAISVCDTVACMWGIGKATAIDVLSKGHSLDKLGDLNQSIEDVIAQASGFVAACYGRARKLPADSSMSKLRYLTWLEKVGNRKTNSSPKLRSLPPTTEAFGENVKRAHLQTAIWKGALEIDPPDADPTEYGWSKSNDSALTPVALPTDVAIAPEEVLKLIRCGCASERPCSSNRCSCSSDHLPCTIFCNCRGGDECSNIWTKAVAMHENND